MTRTWSGSDGWLCQLDAESGGSEVHRLETTQVRVPALDLVHTALGVGDVGDDVLGKQRPHALEIRGRESLQKATGNHGWLAGVHFHLLVDPRSISPQARPRHRFCYFRERERRHVRTALIMNESRAPAGARPSPAPLPVPSKTSTPMLLPPRRRRAHGWLVLQPTVELDDQRVLDAGPQSVLP
jgi:hypothetical protein